MPTLGQSGNAFYTLYNALGAGSAGSSSGRSATGAQQNAAARAAGLMGGISNAGYNPAGLQDQSAKLQNQLLSQTVDQRKRILDLLLGNFSGGGNSGGAPGGVGSLLAQLEGAGQGTRNVINENFDNLASSTQARFAQYGMGGSSGVPSVLSGIERQRALALGELDDQLITQRIGVQERGMDRALQLQQIMAGLL